MGVNRPGHEADHTPPPSAQLKDQWSCTSTENHLNKICLRLSYLPKKMAVYTAATT